MITEWMQAAKRAIPEDQDTCIKFRVLVIVPSRLVDEVREEALDMLREYGSAEIEEATIITEKDAGWFS